MDYKEAIAAIKTRRLQLNQSLDEVGQQIGKSKQFVSQVEKADGANFNTIAEICKALNLQIIIKPIEQD